MYLMIHLQVQYLIIVTVLVSIYTLVLISIDRSANIRKGRFTVILAIDRRYYSLTGSNPLSRIGFYTKVYFEKI